MKTTLIKMQRLDPILLLWKSNLLRFCLTESKLFELTKFCSADSASLGAAVRAAHGWLCHKKGAFVPIKCMYMDKLEQTSLNCKLSAPAGDQELVAKYTLLMKKRAEIENDLVQKLGRI